MGEMQLVFDICKKYQGIRYYLRAVGLLGLRVCKRKSAKGQTRADKGFISVSSGD